MMLSEKPRSPPVVSEHRKVTKSAMEKKRRARINSSLTELKSILAGIMAYKEERFEKMEKADILEMTVNYVRQLQTKTSDADPSTHRADNYRTGVNSCIGEVIRYVTASDICDTDTKTKLLDHIANNVTNLSTTAQSTCLHSPVRNSTNHTVNAVETVGVISTDANNNVKDAAISKQPVPVNVCASANTCAQSVSTPSACKANIYTTMNSVQTISAYTPQIVTSVNSLPTSLPVTSVQNISQIGHTSPQLMPNVPLTILVPANFCTNAAGTTCVIPVTWSNPSTESKIAPSINENSVERLSGSVIVPNEDSNKTEIKPDSKTQQKRPRDSDMGDTKPSSKKTKVTVDPVCSQLQRPEVEIETLSKQPQYKDVTAIREKVVTGLVERVSENIPRSQTVSELPHSEYSLFQKYNSLKAPSPINRLHSVWRPW